MAPVEICVSYICAPEIINMTTLNLQSGETLLNETVLDSCCCYDEILCPKSSQGRTGFTSACNSILQSAFEERQEDTQGKNLEASLLAIPHITNHEVHFTTREGTAGSVENVDCWPLCGLMPNWLSYTGQAHEPRDCNSRNGLAPPTSIQNQCISPLT